MNNCNNCGKIFTHSGNLKRHIKNFHSMESETKFLCNICGKRFSRKDYMKVHNLQCGKKKRVVENTDNNSKQKQSLKTKKVKYSTNSCSSLSTSAIASTSATASTSSSSPTTSMIHRGNSDVEVKLLCEVCGKLILKKNLLSHRFNSTIHKNQLLKNFEGDKHIFIIENAFKNRIITYRVSDSIDDNEKCLSIHNFVEKLKNKLKMLIEMNLLLHTTIKINVIVFGLFEQKKKTIDLQNGEEEEQTLAEIKNFQSGIYIICIESDMETIFEEIIQKLNAKSEEFQERESGWAIKQYLYIELNINKYNPLRGSSYIPLPKAIILKKAVVNVQNNDNACFAWALTSALYPASINVNRTTSYPHYSTVINMGDISFPVCLNDIKKVEILNNVSINVYGLSENHEIIGPFYFSSNKNERRKHVNLLYIEDGDLKHYCWIKNLSRLISHQLSLHHASIWFCDGCLQYFSSQQRLSVHMEEECKRVKSVLPSTKINENGVDNSILKFKNIKYKMPVPFVIYGDFESILEPLEFPSYNVPNSEISYTQNTQKHTPSSFGYYIKCNYNDNYSKYVSYRGEECMKKFVDFVKRDIKFIHEQLKKAVPMSPLTEDEKKIFLESEICFLCENKFSDDINHLGSIRVRDHCHLSGKFRGAAHYSCNLKYTIPKYVPFVFHNLSGYDSHFIVKELGFDNEKIDIIANNKERYISFTKYFRFKDDDDDYDDDGINIEDGESEQINYGGMDETEEIEEVEEGESDHHRKKKYDILKLRFIDSFKFLTSSLEKLSETLTDSQFNVVRNYFTDDEKFNLIRKKGIFPYNYVTSLDVLNETSLPLKEEFCNVSNEDFVRAQTVWNVFECSTLGEYSDLYLMSDILMLADIFENFRKTSLSTYQLDPAHYFTLPGLSWDAMLRFTKIEMQLLTDVDMVHFIQKGIRGGLSQVSKKYATANNVYMQDKYNPNMEENFIIYLDVCNLYGHSLSQHLPYANFEWIDVSNETTARDYEKILDDTANDSDVGYIAEVDIDYPKELHDLHNDYPFCMVHEVPPTPESKYRKLLANVENKKKYVIHYKYLKLCRKHGLKLIKIHRLLKFSQKPFLKDFIDLNTSLRAKARFNSEKDLYKLINNACFGKAIEDVLKRVDIKLLTHWENIGKKYGCNTYISRPNFHSSTVFHENLVAIQMKKTKVFYNKPIYLGFTVLDYSKAHMYEFFYEILKPKYGDNVKLMYTDTDSFIIDVKTKCFYTDLKNDNDFLKHFDTSDFVEDNIYGLPRINKKVVGKMKDEMSGSIITEFIGLKAKCYSFVTVDRDIMKKAKGVKKNIVDTKINFSDYRNCLMENKRIMREQTVFRSDKHEIYTQNINKLVLSKFDDKRFQIPHTFETLPWGHYKIDEEEN